jgi:hypothetical protein
MKPILRILIQLVVAGPIVIYAPFAILMGVGTIMFLFTGEYRGISKTVGYGFGWIGLFGLYGSIFTPLRTIRAHHWLRQTVIGGIVCGFIATAAIVMEDGNPISFFSRDGLFSIWLLAGPVIIGIWNLFRISKTEPNQALHVESRHIVRG